VGVGVGVGEGDAGESRDNSAVRCREERRGEESLVMEVKRRL